jgi:hypothetical protein
LVGWRVRRARSRGARRYRAKIEDVSVGEILDFPAKFVRVGQTFGFAFPAMHNVSERRMTLERVGLVHVPAGVRIVKYKLLSIRETPGYLLDSRPGSGDDSDYEKYRNYDLDSRITVRAHSLSDYYPVVYIRVTGPLPITHRLSGCEYTYSQSGKTYQQTLPCTYSLDGPGP